ncbi:MAG: hypothetical protein ACI9UR_001980 [Bacteroidia bacterium]|jgi:hypothetical protein
MPKALFRILFSVLTLAVLATGCKKGEIIVPNNQAPPDSTISTLILENYVAKCYISLLGREPSNAEEANAVATLSNGNLSQASRQEILANIINNDEYAQKIIEYNATKLLNGAFDTTEIRNQIYLYTNLLSDPQYAEFYDLINEAIDDLEDLLSTPQELANGTIGVREMHKRMVSNLVYDEINMGSFNFVQSLFNNFLFRDPTTEEHNAGITMVDGFVAILFFQTGNSKEQCVDIFLNSDDYYEGQVRDLYLRYLFREPTSEEQGYYANSYFDSDDFDQLQKDILSLDEFAGL